MTIPEDAPTFIATPKGDELVIMTRAAYERLTAGRPRADDAREDAADAATARRARADWEAAGRPAVPLAVLRRVRAGDTYLLAFRAERGLSQTKLATMVGITQGYLSEIECSRKAPREETRLALAKALDIHPVFLSDEAPKLEG